MKDKEWLKEEIESDGVQLEYLYANYYTDDKAIMIDDVRHLIDQLDEPEITEEMAWEVIERANHYHIAPADVWKYKEAIQKGILPSDISKPELPVIPKFVADWIIEYKEIYDTREIIYQLDSTLVNLDVDMWIESNFEKFYRAWLLGYTIEPQKNLQVIVKNYDSTVYTTELPEDEAMKLIEGWKGNE